MFVRLSALAALLLTGSVSAFAPIAHPFLKATSHLTAVAKPSTEPHVFFQNRIAEPADIGSVPFAAAWLSTELPEEPFVIHYRSTNIYDDIEKRPVLDLSVLKNIEVDGNSVTVDPGVTIGQLATKLKASKYPDLKELFTALPAIPKLSIIEAAVDGRFAKLNKAIEEVHVVDKDGNISSKQLSNLNIQQDIIVNAVLSPQPRDSSGLVARWYSWKSIHTPPPDGFVFNLPEDVKVIAHKHGMFNNIPNIVVFVDSGRDLELSKEEWNEVLVETPQELWELQTNLADSGGFETLTATGVLDLSEINPSFSDILEVFQVREQNLMVWVEHDKIRASFPADDPPDIDEDTAAFFKFDEKVSQNVSHSVAKALFSDRKADTQLMIKEKMIEEGTRIPGFKGEVYDGVRGQMQEKRFQYATSSYDNMMNPSLIVYPLDAEDVSAAIKYATLDKFEEVRKTIANPSGRKYKVMARGGGHQYCGVSCDNGNLIISLEHLNRLEANEVDLKSVTGPDGEKHDVEIELQIGTGNKLRRFGTFNNRGGHLKNPFKAAKGYNNNFGWTIPHGECPTVGVGGHTQTGGYGHITRAFGLAIDYVYGFTIVLADGEIRTVNRDSKEQADKDLYWAVLGGSPGAFGVNTNLVIHPILDKDYPHSTGYKRAIFHTDKRMLASLAILEDFINRSKEGDENAMCDELDLQVSLSSNSGNRFFKSLDQQKDSILPNLDVILFELECRDSSNPKAKVQFQEIIDKFEDTVFDGFSPVEVILKKWNGKKHKKLSEMSLGFVRAPPEVTSGGRENRKPYRKMTYGSKDKLKEGWSKAFGDLLNDVVATEDDISCIFQVTLGGGKLAQNGKANLNSIAHRNVQLNGIVFDLFRGEDDDSIKAADAFSRRFEIDVVNRYQTAHPHVMAQWASHGDLDMNKQEVWEKYYDDPAVYHKLRRIKKEVDPNDVFHSRFTIRPAED